MILASGFEKGGADDPTGAKFSPTGNFFAAFKHVNGFALWDLKSGKRLTVVAGMGCGVIPWFHPDGKLLCPCGMPTSSYAEEPDDPVPCYDVSGAEVRRVEGFPRPAFTLFSPDARVAAAFDFPAKPKAPIIELFRYPDALRFLDLPSGRERAAYTGLLPTTYPFSPEFGPTEFSPDGRTLALYAVRFQRDPLLGVAQRFPSLWRYRAFSRLARGDQSAPEILLIDTATGRKRGQIPLRPSHKANRLVFSRRGDLVAFETRENSEETPGVLVEVWDVPPRRPTWGLVLACLAAATAMVLGRWRDARRGRDRTSSVISERDRAGSR